MIEITNNVVELRKGLIVMIEDLFRVKFKTAEMTLQNIKTSYEGNNVPSDQQLEGFLKAYHALNGVEVLVFPFNHNGENRYTIAMWDEGNSDIEVPIREFFYQMEQDELCGQYVDEREEFLRDWGSDDYSAAGAIVFEEQEVEILEVIESRRDQMYV